MYIGGWLGLGLYVMVKAGLGPCAGGSRTGTLHGAGVGAPSRGAKRMGPRVVGSLVDRHFCLTNTRSTTDNYKQIIESSNKKQPGLC